MTGGRLKRVKDYLNDETFLFTYGDGVGNVDIKASLNLHNSSNRKATMTAVQPPGRFGALHIEGDKVTQFQEKPEGDGSWINGGFFVLEPSVMDYIESDSTIWERSPLETLASEGELSVYKHNGFWCPMDTMRDKIMLNEIWEKNKAPWKLWE
jgi:glucose-1-phosphate cytidylyltransferase